jgi:hypothetical protein
VTPQGMADLPLNNEDKLHLKVKPLPDNAYFISLEYQFGEEGVVCIITETKDQDDQKFQYQADYLLRGIPFTLLTAQFQASEEQIEPFSVIFFKDFDNGVISGKDNVIKKLEEIVNLGFDKEDLPLQSTHKFITFKIGTGEPDFNLFQLHMDNNQAKQFIGNDFETFEIRIPDIKQVTEYLNQLKADVVGDIYNQAITEAEQDISDIEQKETRLAQIEEFKLKMEEEIDPLFNDYIAYLTENEKKLFSFESKDNLVGWSNSMLSTAKNSDLAFSSSLFYINKYLYEQQLMDINPNTLINEIANFKGDRLEMALNFVQVVQKLIGNLMPYLEEIFKTDDYEAKTTAFCDEVLAQINKQVKTIIIQKDNDTVAQLAKNKIEKVIRAKHIAQGINENQLAPYIIDFAKYIIDVEGEEIFDVEKLKQFVITYLILEDPSAKNLQILEYEGIQGQVLINAVRKLILM